MALAGETGLCPRCSAPVQPQEPFCHKCGMVFAPAPDIDRAVLQPGYSETGKRPTQSKGMFYTVMAIVLGIILVLSALWFAYLSPNHAHSPFFARHDLPSTLPLPDNVTFDLSRDISQPPVLFSPPVTFHQSVWSAQGQSAVHVLQFYRQALPASGWTSIHQASDGADNQRLSACQNDQVLAVFFSDTERQLNDENGHVVATVQPPPGGSIFQFVYATINDAQVRAGFCNS